MSGSRRTPTVRLPRTDRPFGAGIGLAALLHVALLLALILGGPALADYARGLGLGPGDPGGGGGGLGAKIDFIQLPPLGPAKPAAAQAVPPPVPVPEPALTLPEPELAAITPEPTRLETAVETQLLIPPRDVANIGGTTGGPGAGPGTGGGVGAGQGTGVGTAIGPGTGGDGGTVRAPEVRVVAFPFEDAPSSIKGREFKLHFWVDAQGRVTKVEIEPAIADASFRKKLLERLHQWTFYPARTFSGAPVNGRLTVSYTP